MFVDTYEVVWDGRREGPGGALLNPVEPPRSVTPKQWLVLPPDAPKRDREEGRKRRESQRVKYQRLWTRLETPASIEEIAVAVGCGREAANRVIWRFISYGFARRAGVRQRASRRPHIRRDEVLYARAEQFQAVETYPPKAPR